MDNQQKRAAIETCALLADLPDEDKIDLARVVEPRRFEAGDTLFRQGDKATGFHIVTEGQLKVCRLGKDGREQVLHMMGVGDMVGEVPVFQGGRYPATAIAEVALATLYVPGVAFLELGESRPQLLLDMLAVLSRKLRGFVELIDDLSLKEVSARLAKYLQKLSQAQGQDSITLDSSKAVLASRLGTIAETLSRTLKKMQQRGILTVEGKTIHIDDAAGLQRLVDGAKL